jgi:hypothetical protein
MLIGSLLLAHYDEANGGPPPGMTTLRLGQVHGDKHALDFCRFLANLQEPRITVKKRPNGKSFIGRQPPIASVADRALSMAAFEAVTVVIACSFVMGWPGTSRAPRRTRPARSV